MRLRTQFVAATLLFTVILTAVLSSVFLSEILRERIAQTEASNSVLLHQITAATGTSLQKAFLEHPLTEPGEAAFDSAVTGALQTDVQLRELINQIVRYSPDVQDAYVTSANGTVLVGSSPLLTNAVAPVRHAFLSSATTSLGLERKLIFGAPEALDVSLPLLRNGQPFLTAHLGIRSTFLRNAYAPWLKDAALVCVVALVGAVLLAAITATVASRPIEQIGRELEMISARGSEDDILVKDHSLDPVTRVSSTISRIDQQIRTSEQSRSELSTDLNSMLHTMKDGVLLFTADLRVAVATESTARFLPLETPLTRGTPLTSVFPLSTEFGTVLADLLTKRQTVHGRPVSLGDGRVIEFSLDNLPSSSGMGALLTLRDLTAQAELERDIEVSRRLASIGRLTSGIGHEVKNPINAMVVHLELLRDKLNVTPGVNGAMRHVDVLTNEMLRLDRVVQTLADFSRPLEPVLTEQNLFPLAQAVVNLISEEAANNNVVITLAETTGGRTVSALCDAELLRQALLNIALNAMQAMPNGGTLHLHVTREGSNALITLRDTGPGIPPEILARIFDLYFTTKDTGSGIGLSMTYRILQMHGGSIDVYSETDPDNPEHGTSFTLRLPLAVRHGSRIEVKA